MYFFLSVATLQSKLYKNNICISSNPQQLFCRLVPSNESFHIIM